MKSFPSAENKQILDFAMQKIKSVPYSVSARWIFYQLVQEGMIAKKNVGSFTPLISKARKRFYKEWRPDTLTDTVRHCDFRGEGKTGFNVELDSIEGQENYVQLWFEAEAMHQQFEYYTKDYRVSLIPFRGDVSVPIKWQLAKKLEAISAKYSKPVRILYFGDCDKKGFQIPVSALKDIRKWCSVPFEVERVGLTLDQAKKLNLPENPNPKKQGQYQWEALSDEQAKEIIVPSLERYLTKTKPWILSEEATVRQEIWTAIQSILKKHEIDVS